MTCPYCNSPTKVTNSRSHNKNQAVWRRRKCKNCNALWSTDERYNLDTTHRVINSSQKHPEPFSRDTLYLSIWKALQHRKLACTEAGALTDTIIAKVLLNMQPIIKTSYLKAVSLDTLKAFDLTAESIYRSLTMNEN